MDTFLTFAIVAFWIAAAMIPITIATWAYFALTDPTRKERRRIKVALAVPSRSDTPLKFDQQS